MSEPSNTEIVKRPELSPTDLTSHLVPQLDSEDSLLQIDMEDQEGFLWDTKVFLISINDIWCMTDVWSLKGIWFLNDIGSTKVFGP